MALLRDGLTPRATLAERRALEVTLRWLRPAAVLGDIDARELLSAVGEPRPRPELLDPRDLLAFDGSQVVRRPLNPGVRLVEGALELEGEERVRRLGKAAEEGVARAQWELARAAEGRPREWLVWAGLAAVAGGGSDGHQPARLAVGRALLTGRGCEPDPAAAVRWLGSVREVQALDERGPTREAVEAGLWLGLARFAGRGLPADPAGGLEQMRAALLAVQEIGPGRGAALLRQLEAAAADGDEAAREALEALGDEAPPLAPGAPAGGG
jgi:TPR repeat protein